MGITVRIGPYRRKKKQVEEEWYLSPAERAREEQRFIQTYFAPPEPSITLLKCEHGIYLGDQRKGYCTACTQYDVSGPKPRKKDGIGLALNIGRSSERLSGQTAFNKPFRRRGFVPVQCQVLPPVDQRLKMRTAEAIGGYVRKGIAVKAEKGYSHKSNEKNGAESFVRLTPQRSQISFATMPNPKRGYRAWTYPESDEFFKYAAVYRNQYRTVPPPADYSPRPAIIYFGRQDYGGMRLSSENLPKARKSARRQSDSNQHSECSELSGIDWKAWRPPDYEPTERELRVWRKKYLIKRAPHDPTEGSREGINFEQETRTDRETRASLKVQWGGRWRPKEMHERVWERLHTARKNVAATGTGPAVWSEERERRSIQHCEETGFSRR